MSSSSPFRDAEGKPIVCTSFCVFADILGFSQRVLNCADAAQSNELCKFVCRVLRERREELDGYPSRVGDHRLLAVPYQMFSDSLVLAYPVTPSRLAGEPELIGALHYIENYQCILALRGFFLRGAVTCGELHMSEELCFGKALIEAHRLERNRANAPRIILSPSVKQLVRHHLTFYGRATGSPPSRQFLVDDDDQLFVNYLQAVNYADYSDLHMLAEHRDQVVKGLETYEGNDKILNKYLWLRDYHNFFCEDQLFGSEECPLSAYRIAGLKIDVSDSPVRTFRQLSEHDAQRLFD